MENEDEHISDESLFGWVFADALVSFLAIFIVLFTVLLASINAKKDDNMNSIAQGRVCAELYWDNNRDVDLDLWGKSPVDTLPVGYSHMHDMGLDLFRDVIGWINNPEHVNMEIMCANKKYKGEWTFNVHYFSDHKLIQVRDPKTNIFVTDPNYDSSIKARMILRIYDSTSGSGAKIYDTSVKLAGEGEQKTMFNFRLDEKGEVIEGSMNHSYKQLR